MITSVGRALVLHELVERTRDRWVIVVSALFALLASAVSLYGHNAGDNAGTLTGPSLVTLASLLVPLVALVLSHDAIVGERDRNTLGLLLSLPVSRSEVVVAKFVGRAIALTLAVSIGLGVASFLAGGEQGVVIRSMTWPTVLLGLAFLSVGLLISSTVDRPATASSLVVVVWFLLVFFYDLGLLGLLVITDGGIAADTISTLVTANAAGLYRLQMMEQLAGPDVLENLGMTASLPSPTKAAVVWMLWIVGPVALSAVLVSKRKVYR